MSANRTTDSDFLTLVRVSDTGRLESGFDDLQEGIEVEGIVPGRVVKIVVVQPAHAPADTAPTFDGDPTAFRMDHTRRFALGVPCP